MALVAALQDEICTELSHFDGDKATDTAATTRNKAPLPFYVYHTYIPLRIAR